MHANTAGAFADYCMGVFDGEEYEGIMAFKDLVERNKGNYIGLREDHSVHLEGTIHGSLDVHTVDKYRQNMSIPVRSEGQIRHLRLPHELAEEIVDYLDDDEGLESSSGVIEGLYTSHRSSGDRRDDMLGLPVLVYVSEERDYLIARTDGNRRALSFAGWRPAGPVYELQIGR